MRNCSPTGFIVYTAVIVVAVCALIFWYVPRHGQTYMIIYVGICSLVGSLTVQIHYIFESSHVIMDTARKTYSPHTSSCFDLCR